MNIYSLLADLVLAIHCGIIAFVVFGQVAILVGWCFSCQWIRNPWFRLPHVGTIVFVAIEAMVSFECPFTTWEFDLRVAAGQVPADFRETRRWSDDEFGLISRTLRAVTFFDPEAHGRLLEASYYIFAGVTLATFFVIPPRFRRKVPEA